MEVPSWMHVAHRLPGRLRVRLPALRHSTEEAQQLIDELVRLEGVSQAQARLSTGSVLVHYDPDDVDEAEVIAHLTDAARAVAARVGRSPGDLGRAERRAESMAHATVQFFREVDRDIERVTDGAVDLGTLVTAGFVIAGALQVVSARKIPAPPWFNLAWWGFRTFMTLESEKVGLRPAPPAVR